MRPMWPLAANSGLTFGPDRCSFLGIRRAQRAPGDGGSATALESRIGKMRLPSR